MKLLGSLFLFGFDGLDDRGAIYFLLYLFSVQVLTVLGFVLLGIISIVVVKKIKSRKTDKQDEL